VFATAEAGASPSLCEFDPLMRTDSAAEDSVLQRDGDATVGTYEVLLPMC